MKPAVAALCLCLAACQTISTFDSTAYQKQTESLAAVLKLMDKATTDYASNTEQIEATNLKVEEAYEFDRGRPLNQITIAQWDLIRDPNRNTYAGFLKLWKARGTLGAIYVQEKKKQIAVAWDQIIQ